MQGLTDYDAEDQSESELELESVSKSVDQILRTSVWKGLIDLISNWLLLYEGTKSKQKS